MLQRTGDNLDTNSYYIDHPSTFLLAKLIDILREAVSLVNMRFVVVTHTRKQDLSRCESYCNFQ